MSYNYSVEIDCPPGPTRPDTHFNNMCKNCSLDPNWFSEPIKTFGNWEWNVKPQFDSKYKEKINDVKIYLINLYRKGIVRYASW